MNTPELFGIKYSNRDFSQKESWGKNQFNSSFPAALSNYLHSKGLDNIYLYLDNEFRVCHGLISSADLFGLPPLSDELFFSFESPFSPYQQYLVGSLPRVDLVTQSRNTGQVLKYLEVKLCALPDHTTCDYEDDKFGTEIVIRPDSIIYLACSMVQSVNNDLLPSLFSKNYSLIRDWTEGRDIWNYIPFMIQDINRIISSLVDRQIPLLMQPIWKTEGKSPKLAENCLDVFIWSNLAFTRLFLDIGEREFRTENNKITRQLRTIIWLFKMLYDYSLNAKINFAKIIDELSYNTKNDKAFAVSGRITHSYMASEYLTLPRVSKHEIKQIILGGGQNLLSPERRFDAIIFNTPELFS